jgi:homoserine kinase
MSAPASHDPNAFRMRLPATSANLGPGFDTAAVALDFYLDIAAAPAEEFSISATGWDAERCARLHDNLILDIYSRLLREQGRPVVPLAIQMANGIPLGMGCGSSAAGRLAAIALAVHFGGLDWNSERILEEACALEGHPDNAAACWLGGFVAAACDDERVHYARVVPPPEWRAIVVLPAEPLATSHARAMLPASYARADVVANIQSASLLGLAFALGRGDLLRVAMKDRIHQPYRAAICPFLGAALSGAGPAVLVIAGSDSDLAQASEAIQAALKGTPSAELLLCRFEPEGASKMR